MEPFEELWRGAVRTRRVARELEPLVRGVHDAIVRDSSPRELRDALETLLVFLAGDGHTDANCCATDSFFGALEGHGVLERVPPPLYSILNDLSGTLHDAIYAPQIARTFESLPEQLLARIRAL